MKQDSVTFNHVKVVNIYIFYKISKSINISNYPTLENCLFGAVTLTKSADINKCKYSEYGIGFDSFSFSITGLGQNVRVFEVDMSSSVKIDDRKKDILILAKGPMQGSDKMYSINFTEHSKTFCLSLHYNRANSSLFVNGKEI